MAAAVYILCALTSFICAVLLWRGYRSSRVGLLKWSAFGFAGLALNNMLLVADRLLVPDVNLTVVRVVPAVLGMMVLVYGLVRESP